MRTFASEMYALTVLNCALDLAGQGAFTIRDLSEKCSMRNTQHLRRNLRQWVAKGKLIEFQAYTDDNRLALFYTTPKPVEQLPFAYADESWEVLS